MLGLFLLSVLYRTNRYAANQFQMKTSVRGALRPAVQLFAFVIHMVKWKPKRTRRRVFASMNRFFNNGYTKPMFLQKFYDRMIGLREAPLHWRPFLAKFAGKKKSVSINQAR